MEASVYLQEGASDDSLDAHPGTWLALRAFGAAQHAARRLVELAAASLLLLLALCEQPALPCLEIPVLDAALLESLCLFVIFLCLVLKLLSTGSCRSILTTHHSLLALILLVHCVEVVVVVVRQSPHLRLTRALRPIYLVHTHHCRRVRRNLEQMIQSLPPILDMLTLLLYFMVIFAILGFYFFSEDEDDPYFKTLDHSLVNLFILLTTANYPDVMLPSYSRNPFSCIFFIAYLSVELYFLTNLLLAVVFHSFSRVETAKLRGLLLHRREAARKSYQLLLSQSNPRGVELHHLEGLMRYLRPRASSSDVYLTFKLLAQSNSGYIT
ncbi:two pore channel protein 1 [Lampetra fluviatilis]